jgi:hypothetical protein
MIHRDGIAVLFGYPHCGKSFFALDVALSFASGKPWCLGEGAAITAPDGGPGVVHYIMAEAPGTNIGRGNAWLRYHGITVADLGGRFHPMLDSFLLTEAGIVNYLERVDREHPDLIIYDTRSAMFDGQEATGEDFTEMLRAMRTIRKVNDKDCAQIALDHPGLNNPDRPRGNNAWEAGSDSMIQIIKDRDSGLHTVTVKRDRSAAESGAGLGFRRETVVVSGRSEAVLVAAEVGGERQPFTFDGSWNNSEPMWEDVAALRGDGRKYAVYVTSILRWTDLAGGLLMGDFKAAVEAAGIVWKRDQYNRGTGLLERHGVIEHPVGASARWALTPPYEDRAAADRARREGSG